VSSAPASDPVELLRELIRFDTTNPPGNEGPCIDHLRDMRAVIAHGGAAGYRDDRVVKA
jgi:hypothetical protein